MAEKIRICDRCGAEIPSARLEALPDTRICVQCSREVGGEYEVRVVSENVGKAGSLKKNYGGFSVRKRRRVLPPKGNGE
jgi:hypothetical protein